MSKLYFRHQYLDRIEPYIDQDLIKVIVGQRRVGKSYLLLQVMDLLRNRGIAERQIIFIDKEDRQFDFIESYRDLYQYIDKNKAQDLKKCYLFIDEVQEIKSFEKAVRAYNHDKSFDVYITGSNSSLFSSELSTLLSGRYIQIPIYSLNFQEFTGMHSLKPSEEALKLFLKYGGLPYLTHLDLNQQEVVYEYIRNVYNNIIYKDIVQRFAIRNTVFLEKLLEFLAQNIGNIFSANKISNYLASKKIAKIDPRVIIEYTNNVLSTYLFFEAKRAKITGKKVFSTNSKYYIGDLGLRHAVLGFHEENIDQIIENIVYLHLLTKGYSIHVGCLGEKEIDFVIEKNGYKAYIQVTYLLYDQKVKDREFGNLLGIPDNYEKYVISMDPISGQDYQGIKHISLLDFLLEFS